MIRAQEEPDDAAAGPAAGRQPAARRARPAAAAAGDRRARRPDRDAKAGLAFITILILYGQLLTYGFWVASGVVEEKSSRVIEVLLAAIRPRDLLAGKVARARAARARRSCCDRGRVRAGRRAAITGAIDVRGDVVGAVALSLVWFVLGYAFYASAFAVAGALVPRLEELQATTTPLTLTIVVSLLVGFAVNDDPTGRSRTSTAFIPMTAPITMPSRIILGDAPAWEIVGVDRRDGRRDAAR